MTVVIGGSREGSRREGASGSDNTVIGTASEPEPAAAQRPVAAGPSSERWNDPEPAPGSGSRWKDGFALRGPLLCVLIVQVGLTLRLGNSAFQDEALYLYAGHREIALLLHGTSTFDNYASYFSGAPFLYPIFGAVLDGIGGLALARAASLVLMLATTALLYTTTRRLIGRPAALFAALVFAVAEPTLFVGRLATFDAPALLLLAVAFWLVVRTAARTPLAVVPAAPVLVLAGAVKYVSVLYWPTVVVLAVLVTVPFRGWFAAVRRGGWLTAATAACAWALLRLAPSLRAGIATTTSQRAHGSDAVSAILFESARYIGIALALGIAGSVLYARSGRSTRITSPDDFPERSGVLRWTTGLVLTGTALLAPVNQAHLQTLTSLQKHTGFGLLFAAPMAGLALAWLLMGRAGRDIRRTGLAFVACLALAWTGANTSQQRFADWPNSQSLIQVLKAKIRPVNGRYLVEESEVSRYYLHGLSQPYQWTGTYYFQYHRRYGATLTGVAAYRAAIADRYFDVIALRYGPTAVLDTQIDSGLRSGGGYTLVAKLPYQSSYGPGYWWVWSRS